MVIHALDIGLQFITLKLQLINIIHQVCVISFESVQLILYSITVISVADVGSFRISV